LKRDERVCPAGRRRPVVIETHEQRGIPIPDSTQCEHARGRSQEEALLTDRIKVLYIAGWGRSGSTLMGTILGQLEGFVHMGELRHIWGRGLIENRLCGCGVPLQQCEHWKAVLAKAFGAENGVDPREMIRLRERGTRTQHIPFMYLPGGAELMRNRLGKFLTSLESLYRSIGEVTGCRVIVDSSKNPAYGYALATIPAIELYVLHLVRDPRAVAFSWLRRKLYGEKQGYMEQMAPISSSIKWNLWNMGTSRLRKSAVNSMLLRYEDLVAKPRDAVQSIIDMIQERVPVPPSVTEESVDIGVSHTAWGNPNRLETGTVTLRSDDEWKVAMKSETKYAVVSTTLPLLWRYGYLSKKYE